MICINNLSYSLKDGRLIFKNLNFTFSTSEKTSLIGRNGIGKTTLARLMLGELEATSGNITKNVELSYLSQSLTRQKTTVSSFLKIDKKLNAFEKINSGEGQEKDFQTLNDDWNIEDRYKLLFKKFGISHISFNRNIQALSGGEYTRLSLINAISHNPQYIILDEPTNNLDNVAKLFVREFIKSTNCGILLISHDRELLRLMNQTCELSVNQIKSYGGNYDFYLNEKTIEADALNRKLVNAKKNLKNIKIENQKKLEKQNKKSSLGAKKRKTSNQPKSLLDAKKEKSQKTTAKLHNINVGLEEKSKEKLKKIQEQINLFDFLKIKMPEIHIPASKTILEIKDLSFSYQGSNDALFTNFNFLMKGADRVVIKGKNGSGKSTLFNLISGKCIPISGEIKVGVSSLRHFDQYSLLLDEKLSIFDNFINSNKDRSKSACRTILAAFQFKEESVFKFPYMLSGGERLKAALACTLMSEPPPQLILLDEPTNHMDLDSIDVLEKSLKSYQGALLLISHDEDFIKNIGIQRIIEL